MGADGLFVVNDRCWICGGTDFHPMCKGRFDMTWKSDPVLKQYHARTFWMMTCDGCGFGQPGVMPAPADFFDRTYDLKHEDAKLEADYSCGFRDSVFRVVLDDLESRVKKPLGTLLDVGCHSGRFIALAAERGWKAEAIELNPAAANFAARRTGLTVHRMNAHELASHGKSFDVVTILDVLEHIPQPLAALESIGTLVRPGGLIAVKVPCGANQLWKNRFRAVLHGSRDWDPGVATNLGHVNQFGTASLRRTLTAAGFSQIEMLIGAPETIPHPALLRRLVSRLIRSMTYGFGRALPFGVNTPLAMNLQSYATKDPSAQVKTGVAKPR